MSSGGPAGREIRRPIGASLSSRGWGRSNGPAARRVSSRALRLLVVTILSATFVLYVYVTGTTLLHQHRSSSSSAVDQAVAPPSQRRRPLFEEVGLVQPAVAGKVSPGQRDGTQQEQQRQKQQRGSTNSSKRYPEWRKIAVDLAGMKPADVLSTLERDDPFGVRTFERRLLEEESNRGSILTPEEIGQLFPCPHDRITLPDRRDHGKDEAFRRQSAEQKRADGGGGGGRTKATYLFHQHLRKAGGTNFCELAKNNLPRDAVPRYYCMPDYYWNMENRCAGCLNRFTNDDIEQRMTDAGHRVIGNEWDPFDPTRFFDLPGAVFATSFRKPLDRALSQFRFECVEDRGCKVKRIEDWWTKRKDLTNVYTWTFTKQGVRKLSVETSASAAQKRREVMGRALDAVSRFHLILVMEWLAYAGDEVRSVLGFDDVSSLTRRTRPHVGQAKRDDGQETNVLGAAGITKASWDPREYLSSEQYRIMSEDLALDEVLTDAARRMFLERLVCSDH